MSSPHCHWFAFHRHGHVRGHKPGWNRWHFHIGPWWHSHRKEGDDCGDSVEQVETSLVAEVEVTIQRIRPENGDILALTINHDLSAEGRARVTSLLNKLTDGIPGVKWIVLEDGAKIEVVRRPDLAS